MLYKLLILIDGRDIYEGAVVVVRNYLNPITKTAPISNEIVPNILLRFDVTK